MSAPIDFTWKIDYERSLRKDPEHAARIEYARARLAALPTTTQAITASALRGGAAVSTTIEESMFVRIDWKLKLKEKLWPWSQDKRLAKEAALVAAVAEEPIQSAEEPVEPASLPGAGLQKLKEQGDEPLPPLPVDETDPNMTRGDYDDHIAALPPMPGDQRQISAVSSEDTRTSIHQQSDEEPSLEDLMDDILDAADAPGNRCSVRSPLPQEWRDVEFSGTMSSSRLAQPEVSKSTEYLPLPGAVFAAGLGHLPSLSASRSVPNFAVTSSRPGMARVDGEDGDDGAQATPASGRCFRSVR